MCIYVWACALKHRTADSSDILPLIEASESADPLHPSQSIPDACQDRLRYLDLFVVNLWPMRPSQRKQVYFLFYIHEASFHVSLVLQGTELIWTWEITQATEPLTFSMSDRTWSQFSETWIPPASRLGGHINPIYTYCCLFCPMPWQRQRRFLDSDFLVKS